MDNEGRTYCDSEESESLSEKSFTIIWKIENSEYFLKAGYKLQSPVVFVDVMENTGWRLVLSRLQPYKNIYVTIKREAVDDGPETFDLHYDFDITPIKKGALNSKSCSHVFRKDESGPSVLLYKIDPTIGTCIAIRCTMKKNNGDILVSGQCIAQTRIAGEDFEFIGKVENYSSLALGEKRTLKVLSSSTEERLMIVDLRLESGSNPGIVLDLIPAVEKSGYSYIFSSTILDFLGNETNNQTCCEYPMKKAEELTLFLFKKNLEDYVDYYLQNGTLSLLCKVTIMTGIQSEEIEKVEYGTVSIKDGDQKARSSSYLETLLPAEASSFAYDYDLKSHGQFQNISKVLSKGNDNLSNPFPNALEDITSFYKKGILSDAKLQTATETFHAHKAILSARSPVFEAMFTSNMKEKIEECVHIDDVDAETVKRMLLFLYSDSLEELEWSDAKKLYFAADKYQVLSLKYRCAIILKKSIDLSNCCELLLMADMHRDEDLKAAVKNYIERHDKEVFLSFQWRDMEKSHPLLAIDILRAVHLKNN